MKDETNKNPFEPIIHIFSRYNLVIFIVVVVGGLATSVLTLTNILNIPFTPKNPTSANTTIIIDESTLQRIDTLNSSANNTTAPLITTTRVNLFSE